jgi:hypothetical protein
MMVMLGPAASRRERWSVAGPGSWRPAGANSARFGGRGCPAGRRRARGTSTVSGGRAVAGFDSASAMVRVLGSALHGRDAPLLAQFPSRLEPVLDRLLAGLSGCRSPPCRASAAAPAGSTPSPPGTGSRGLLRADRAPGHDPA